MTWSGSLEHHLQSTSGRYSIVPSFQSGWGPILTCQDFTGPPGQRHEPIKSHHCLFAIYIAALCSLAHNLLPVLGAQMTSEVGGEITCLKNTNSFSSYAVDLVYMWSQCAKASSPSLLCQVRRYDCVTYSRRTRGVSTSSLASLNNYDAGYDTRRRLQL